MSDIYEMLLHSLGTGDELSEISSTLGADPAATQRGIAVAIPALLGALADNASEPSGAQSLFGALDEHDGSVLSGANPLGGLLGSVLGGGGSGGGGLMGGVGGAILGHVLGNKMDGVAEMVAAKSGLDKNLVLKLLPLLAPIVMGFLGKMKKDQGMGLEDLTSVLANEKQETKKKEPGLGGLLDSITGGGSPSDIAGDLLGSGGGGLGSILGKVLGG